MLKGLGIKDYNAIMVGIVLFLLIQPYFIWTLPVQLKLLLQAIPVFFLFLNNDIRSCNTNKIFFALFFMLLVFSCLNQGLSFAFSLYTISFSLFFFAEDRYAFNVYTWFRKILSVVLAISLIVWFLVLLGVGLPYNIIEPLNALKPYDYFQYPLLVMTNSITDLFRFFGPFDEPGVTGTICAMILFIEGYNLKDYFNIPLFIAGLCTLSMFFIGASLFYIGFHVIRKPGSIVLAFLLLFVVFTLTKDIDIFQELVYNRFEYDKSKGTFSGDNRATDDFIQYYNSIKGTSIYFFGADQNIIERFSGSAGYRNAVLKYGAIFCLLYVVLLFLYARSRGLQGRDMFIFAILVLAVFYQRPGFLDPVYIFLFAEFFKIHSKYKNKINSQYRISNGTVYNSMYHNV